MLRRRGKNPKIKDSLTLKHSLTFYIWGGISDLKKTAPPFLGGGEDETSNYRKGETNG